MSVDEIIGAARYARGYLLAPATDAGALRWCQEHGWETIEWESAHGSYALHYDRRVEVSVASGDDRFVCLLGEVVDLEEDTAEKNIIAQKLLEFDFSDNIFLDALDALCGRFVIIYGDAQRTELVQDATGMRSCYYGEKYIASHYGIVNELENHPPIAYWETYKSLPDEKKPWYLPGDLTPYEKVLTLIPHHALNLCTHQVRRVFPRQNRKSVAAPEVAKYFAEMMRRQLAILSRKYKFLVSMTGGHDSRTTLGALKGYQKNTLLFSYLNQSKTDTCAADNEAAKYLADTFGFDFKQLPLNDSIPARLRDALEANHYHRHVPRAIYEIARKLPLEGHLHLRSNILESIRERHFFLNRQLTPEIMCRDTYESRGLVDPTIREAWKAFYSRNQYDRLYDYNPGDIFFEELRMGVWHASGVLLSYDVVFDTYCLFNQGRLLDMGLCMPELYRRSNYLVDRVAEILWPEVMFRCANDGRNLLNYKSSLSRSFAERPVEPKIASQRCKPHVQAGRDSFEIGFASNEVEAGSEVVAEYAFAKASQDRVCSVALIGACKDVETAACVAVTLAVDGVQSAVLAGSDLCAGYRTATLAVPPSAAGRTLSVALTCTRTPAAREKAFALKIFSPVLRRKT